MENRYRAVHRIKGEGIMEDGGLRTFFRSTTLLWSGEDLPTDEKIEKAAIASVSIKHSPNSYVPPNMRIEHEGPILQRLEINKRSKKFGSFVWKNYDHSGDKNPYLETLANSEEN